MPRPGALKQRKTEDGEPAPEPPKPQKIDLHDANAIKHALDSTAAEVGCSYGMQLDTISWSIRSARKPRTAHTRAGARARARSTHRSARAGLGAARASLRRRRPAAQVILDNGYIEDHLISNVKIGLGILA